MFYQAVLPISTSFFSEITPCIHLLCDKLDSFVSRLLGKFVKNLLSEMQRIKVMLLMLTFIPMWINCLILTFLLALWPDKFFDSSSIMVILLSLKWPRLCTITCKFINFENREECDFDSVEYFVHRFSHLQDLTIASEMELLQEEFISYQLLHDMDIPSRIWDEAKVGEDEDFTIVLKFSGYIFVRCKQLTHLRNWCK